jgi:hypothetical protein
MTAYHMVEAQELTPAHAINLAFIHDLPEAKRVPLLAILKSGPPDTHASGAASIEQHYCHNSPAAFA